MACRLADSMYSVTYRLILFSTAGACVSGGSPRQSYVIFSRIALDTTLTVMWAHASAGAGSSRHVLCLGTYPDGGTLCALPPSGRVRLCMTGRIWVFVCRPPPALPRASLGRVGAWLLFRSAHCAGPWIVCSKGRT